MNVIGISGLATSVAFKQKSFPGLTQREYNIVQGLDAAAALVDRSGVIAAAAEERFTHEKGTGAFPINAIRYCLQAGRLRPQEVDLIAHGFSYEPWRSLFEEEESGRRQYAEVYSPGVQRRLLDEHFGEAGWSKKFVPVPHHLAHAASAFYPSGFPEALILVSDGMGEVQSMTVAAGKGTEIKVLTEVPAFHSLGMLYGVFTLYLGFYMGSDEYKVMGLAPYGNPRRFFKKMMEFVSLKSDGTYALPIFSHNVRPEDRETHAGVLRHLAGLFGPAREPGEEISQIYKDIAAALQAVLQTCQLHVLRHFQRQTGHIYLCMAGGVALNCSANGEIRRSGLFDRLFVQPAAGDDGCALGAALYAQRLHDPGFSPRPMTVPLWGPEFSDEEIRRVVAGNGDCTVVELETFDAVCREVAARIDRGQIVGWFQGRMEFGPRALGSRSILADPRDPGMRDRINSLVKKREAFRPFAPVVTREAAAQIFDIAEGQEDTYAHMLFVEQVRPEYRGTLPATTHVDGSARIQTVAREQNPRLWQLLNEFEKLSGLPVLLNTSFNVRGQPIVCTPQEAFDTFLFAKLDVFVAGNLLVIRRPAKVVVDSGRRSVGEVETAAPRPPGPLQRIVPAHEPREPVDAASRDTVTLTKPELRKVLVEWNNTRTEVHSPFCVHQLFEAQAQKTPNDAAVVFEDEELTWRELDRRANRLARSLQKLGVGPDVLVGVCMEVSLEMVVGLLGVLKAGAAYVPLDPDYPKERLEFMIQDARLPVILTQQRLRTLISEAIGAGTASISTDAGKHGATTLICLDTEWHTSESANAPATGVTPNNLAYVIYTSGSTGRPKGVMVTHQNVANFFAGMDHRIGAKPPGVWLAVTSISFDISVLELFWTLSRGFKVVLQRREPRTARARALSPARESKPIDFSLLYFASDDSGAAANKYRLLLEGAKFADTHGFAAVWTPERRFHAFGGLYPNPSVTSAALAATTRRIQIRAGSIVLPLHNPIRVAEEWAVVDNLSNGRAGVSFASGWQVNDFVLAPENYARRKEVMISQIDLVRRLWRGETVAFRGADGREVPVKTLPRPIQAELPFWITASGNPETFRLAGELGGNLLTHLLGQTIEELAEKIAAYRSAWRQAGHAGEGTVTLMLHTFVGGDPAAVRATVRDPFLAYLRSSIDLIKNAPGAFAAFKTRSNGKAGGIESGPAKFSEEELDLMSRHAFDRYFETSGLFGTPEMCLRMVENLRALGVAEIACLIDFGIDTDTVLEGLRELDKVRRQCNAGSRPAPKDYSLPAQVARHGVTHLQCTPSLAAMLVEEPKALRALRSLKMLLLGGEALPADLVQRLDLPGTVVNMYGPTETTVWSTTHVVDKGQKTVSIGRPIANTRIYIVDESLRPTPIGEAGELLIGGAGVVRGYLNRPELTAEKFIPDPFEKRSRMGIGNGQAGARLYRTGDLARYLPDGNIEYLGRIDQQVKLRGFRIELGEIETVLRQHPVVKECAAAVREDRPGDKRLIAYVVERPGQSLAAAGLREFLQSKLPDYMVPSAFVSLSELPLTPNGKLDRKALPPPAGAAGVPTDDHGDAQPQPAVPGAADHERTVATVWRGVLGIDQAGPEDNFFALGGNSILATQLVSRLRKALNWEVPLRLAFEFPTLEGLTQALGREGPTPSESLPPGHRAISRRTNTDEFPLSFAQRRLWFLNQLEPGPHYNDHFDLRLTGPLDVEVLAKALNEVIRRHETLRGTFGSVEGRPVQKVSSTLNLPVPLVDLSELEESERERKAVALAVQETRQLFDLEKGPLLRARLLRLSEREHIFALTFHHIIIDGWSRMVFLRELRAVYEAFRAGGPSPLPGLPIQYSDFAAWQEKWLGGESIARDLAFWRQQLSGVAPVLELPADRPRPPAQSYRGARLPLALDKALLDRVSILGQQEGCTLFMTLLAAFQVLLARYTGRDDIVIGSPIANRNHAEVEGLIGCFLNNLVLRGDLSGDPGFVEILRRVRKVALDAFAHQDLPFEKVVAELQPVRNLGYSPVFQIMFILQNPSAPNAPGGGLTFRPFEIDAGVSKVDLTLNLEEASEAWSGWIEYSTDLFDEARIRRLIEDFRILLEGIVTRPTDRLSQLPPASPKHKEPAPEAGLLQGRTSTDAIDKPVSISRGPRPQTEVEKKLAGIWSEVLGTEKIRLHDSLFDLGGHSLLITMIQSRIRDVFEVEIPLQAFFEMPTLGDISTLIESRLSKRLAHV